MTKQLGVTKQLGMTTHQSLPAATGNLINPTVTPTYPPVTPDLSSSHPRLIRQSSRAYPAVIPDLIGDLPAVGLHQRRDVGICGEVIVSRNYT